MKTSILIAFLLIGQYLCQVPIAPRNLYADVVFIVDETIFSRTELISFMNTLLPRFEQMLVSSGLGGQFGVNINNYGLVLFGSSEHSVPYRVQFNGGLLVEPGQFISQAINQIQSTSGYGNNGDGWAAIDSALGYPLRPNAVHKFILISPRYRQIINPTLTRSDLITRMLQQKVMLNVIVNASYVQPNETPDNMMQKTLGLLHYGKQRASVTINGLQSGQNFTIGGRILGPMSDFTTIDDYVFLAQELSREQCLPSIRVSPITVSSSFDFKFIQHSGQDTEFLIQAFLNAIKIEMNPSLLSSLPLYQQPGTGGDQIPLPTVGQCPFSQYNPMLVNSNLFFMVRGSYNLAQARVTCIQQRAQLAVIQSIEDARSLQSFNTPLWISSFADQSNDRMSGSNIALRSGQMISVQSTETFSSLCYVSPIPDMCRSVGVTQA